MSERTRADAGDETRVNTTATDEAGGNIHSDLPDATGQHTAGGFVETKGYPGRQQLGAGRPALTVREADHSGVKDSRKAAQEGQESAKNDRAERRKRVKSGSLGGGKWECVGGFLVNMDTLCVVELPNETDENPAITLTTLSGHRVTASGDECRELMEEYGLEANPETDEARNLRLSTVQEGGRLVAPKDLEAEKSARTVVTAPARNPVGGGFNLPQVPITGPSGPGTPNNPTAGADDADADDGEHDEGDDAETETDPATGEAKPKAKRGAKAKRKTR